MTTPSDPLVPLIASAVRTIDALDGRRFVLSPQLPADAPTELTRSPSAVGLRRAGTA